MEETDLGRGNVKKVRDDGESRRLKCAARGCCCARVRVSQVDEVPFRVTVVFSGRPWFKGDGGALS